MNSIPVRESSTRKAGAGQAWFLILAMFVPILAIIGLAPALPTLLDRFHDTPYAMTAVPMLLTVPSLCIALFGGVAGYLADRFGRRRLMLGAMLAYLLSGLAPFLLHTYSAVLLSRIVLGLAEAFVMAIGNALLADYFPPEEQHKWLTVQGVVGSVLGILLLLASGRLAAMGWQWPFLLYSLTFPIFLLGYFFAFEPERRFQREVGVATTPFPWVIIIPLCSVTLLTAIVYFVEPIQFSLVLRDIGVQDATTIGRLSSIASIAIIVGSLLFKRIATRPIEFQMATVYALMGIGLLGIGLSHDYHVSTAVAAFQQLGNGMAVPVLVAWALSRLPVEHRGRGMGLWASSFFIGQFLSPLAVSTLRAWAGSLLHTVALMGLICLAAALVSAINLGRAKTNLVPQASP